MNREEGFTLVELLAVIVILGIIVAIAIPAVGSIISNAQTDANKAEESLVIEAARMYTISREDELTFVDKVATVSVDTLKLEGYLEERGSTEDLVGDVTITKATLSQTVGETVTDGAAGYSYSYGSTTAGVE